MRHAYSEKKSEWSSGVEPETFRLLALSYKRLEIYHHIYFMYHTFDI